MLSNLLIAWLLMALCVAIHALGLVAAFSWIQRRVPTINGCVWTATWMLIRITGWTVLMHSLQIAVWAFYYAGSGALPSLEEAFYFSAVTYTTTGYGDLVLPLDWRLFGSVEALTGILMCGLSAGLFFACFSSIFGLRSKDQPPAPL